MPLLHKRDNDAVYVNPPVLNGVRADIHITSHGSDWLWAAFSLFALATLVLLALTFTSRLKTFHYIFSIVLFVTALDYFAQASDLGFVPIQVEFLRSSSDVAGLTRQIWYTRYIDWFITFPLIELALLLAARSGVQQILFTIALQWIAIVSWLVAALTESRFKWGFWSIGEFAVILVAYTLLVPVRIHAGLAGSDIAGAYTTAAIYLVFLLIIYAIAFGVSEGGNVIAPDSEMAFYGVLDILSKLGLTFLVLWGFRDIEPQRLGLANGDESHPETGERK